MEYTMKVIARIHSDFPEKFGIPRQSGLVPALRAKIVFEPEYRNPDALRNRVQCTWLRHEPLPPRYDSQPRLTVVRRE